MVYRTALLTSLAAGVAPCAAQGIMVPAPVSSPAVPASPSPSPSANVPAPALASMHEDLLKGFPDAPDLGSFSPQVVSWMRLRAAGLARGGEIPEAEEMPAYIRKAGIGILGNLNSDDIMAVAMIVMMMAAKDAHEDLKSIMEELKKANAEKGELDSLELQKAMGRQSKIISALSNLLKKQSDTARGITQDFK
ncbi:MAG: hypothetical protein Q8M07_31125 [Prosthecobacter sp.]|nr:hypothetical protein [Prosthecobacter sp.]